MAVAIARIGDLVAQNENARLQTARGLACLLLVAFHVIGDEFTPGIGVAPDSPYRIFTQLFTHLRMPLFAFLSGFVYAYRPVVGRPWGFARKKIQRLLIPLLVVCTVFFLMRAYMPGVNDRPQLSQIWRIYVFGYGHFWFLQAMILIFGATILADRWMRSIRGYLIAFSLVLLAHFLLEVHPNVFSVQRALYLAPFFLLGLGANRFRELLWSARSTVIYVAVFAVSMSLYSYITLTEPGIAAERKTLLGTIISLSGCLTVIRFIPSVSWLAKVGVFSFTIYLYHVFFTAGARVGLNLIGDTSTAGQFMVGLAMGVVGPIVLEIFLRRNALARRTLLGQS